MCKALMMVLVAGGLGTVFAKTVVWTGAGENALVSNPANWQNGVAPDASGDVLSIDGMDSAYLRNDIKDFAVNGISFGNSPTRAVMDGLPMTLSGQFAFGGAEGSCYTISNGLYVSGKSYVFQVPDNRTVVFEGLLSHAAPSNCTFHMNGSGTKIIRGGIDVPVCTDTDNNDANGNASRLQYGTFLLESDVNLPRAILGHTGSDAPTHIVVTNDVTLRLWSARNSFVQNAVIDLYGGRFVNEGWLIFAQATTSHAYINIHSNGVFATGTTSFRPGNNGVAEFTVNPGGTLYWQNGPFSENGRSILTMNGGRLIRGPNAMGIGQVPAATRLTTTLAATSSR